MSHSLAATGSGSVVGLVLSLLHRHLTATEPLIPLEPTHFQLP